MSFTMKYDPEKHHRRSIRLKGYDYTQPGAYLVTICTKDRLCLFGEVVDGEMRLNPWGEIVREEWLKTAQIRPYVRLHEDEFVVMPNHVHGIIWIMDDDVVGAWRRRAPTADHDATLERFGAPYPVPFLPLSVRSNPPHKRINALRNTPGVPIWQRNYYEHIIRNEDALNRIRQYIVDNPVRWASDRENPKASPPEPKNLWQS
jgi:putative transposase